MLMKFGIYKELKDSIESFFLAYFIISIYNRLILFTGGVYMDFDCGFTKENHWFRYRAAAIIV